VKLLVLAIDGTGMGHLSRTLVMARALRKARPDAEVKFLVESPVFQMVSAAGFDVLKLPDPRHPLGRHALRGLRSDLERQLVAEACRGFVPDALLVDFLLDRQMFLALHESNSRVLVVLRRQRPKVMRQLGRDPASGLVDTWLVPHAKEDFSPREIPPRIARRCTFLGPVARPIDVERIPDLRRRYASGAEHLALIVLGGGGSPEGREFCARARKALQAVGRQVADLKTVVVWGPLNPEPLPDPDDAERVVRFESDMPELMAAADVVLANAGYNTMRELELSGTPGVVVHLKTTGRDDQVARAQKLREKQLALVADLEEEQITSCATRILEGQGPRKRLAEARGDLGAMGKALAAAMRS